MSLLRGVRFFSAVLLIPATFDFRRLDNGRDFNLSCAVRAGRHTVKWFALIILDNFNMNDRLWELLSKYWINRISAEEKAEMERMLLEHPDHWLKAGLMQQISCKLDPVLPGKTADKITDRILGKTEKTNTDQWYRRKRGRLSIKRYRQRGLAAAVLLILAMAGSWLYFRTGETRDAIVWQQVTTANGMRTTLRLADGSEIWLNAGSTLRYPENFNEKKRQVYLTGEAYFKVAHDAGKPFVIHTADMDVKVLGTEFDVRAYGDEDYSETSLIKGAVEVTVNQGKQKQQIYLKPKQKVVVQKASAEVKKADGSRPGKAELPKPVSDSVTRDVMLEPVRVLAGNIIPETAWKENKLMFENEPLQSLAKRMERWYGVTITIRDSAFARQRFTGSADNVSLEKLLHILQMVKPFKYTMQGKNVIIK